jgi:hypothetical protein
LSGDLLKHSPASAIFKIDLKSSFFIRLVDINADLFCRAGKRLCIESVWLKSILIHAYSNRILNAKIAERRPGFLPSGYSSGSS